MGSAYHNLAYKLTHPSYIPSKDAYACGKCGKVFPAGKKAIELHARHVVENHSREYAYLNIPAKWYDKLYQTERWKAKQKTLKENRLIRKEGFVKCKGSIAKMMGDYHRDGNYYSRDEALKISQT